MKPASAGDAVQLLVPVVVVVVVAPGVGFGSGSLCDSAGFGRFWPARGRTCSPTALRQCSLVGSRLEEAAASAMEGDPGFDEICAGLEQLRANVGQHLGPKLGLSQFHPVRARPTLARFGQIRRPDQNRAGVARGNAWSRGKPTPGGALATWTRTGGQWTRTGGPGWWGCKALERGLEGHGQGAVDPQSSWGVFEPVWGVGCGSIPDRPYHTIVFVPWPILRPSVSRESPAQTQQQPIPNRGKCKHLGASFCPRVPGAIPPAAAEPVPRRPACKWCDRRGSLRGVAGAP